MNNVITPRSILEQAIAKYGSLSAVARKTRVFRSTLKHIRNGDTKRPHSDTIAKLVRLLNDPQRD